MSAVVSVHSAHSVSSAPTALRRTIRGTRSTNKGACIAKSNAITLVFSARCTGVSGSHCPGLWGTTSYWLFWYARYWGFQVLVINSGGRVPLLLQLAPVRNLPHPGSRVA
eukprot:1678554-Rhodomonas_salina.3